MRKLLPALMLSLLCTSTMAQQIYQWTDDQGVVQYGQRPPADRHYQQRSIEVAPPPGGTLRQPNPEPKEPTDKTEQTQSLAEQRRMAAEQKKQQAAACTRLRDNLKTLEDNPRLRRTNKAGEVERIGEDERQQMIQQLREQLKQDC